MTVLYSYPKGHEIATNLFALLGEEEECVHKTLQAISAEYKFIVIGLMREWWSNAYRVQFVQNDFCNFFYVTHSRKEDVESEDEQCSYVRSFYARMVNDGWEIHEHRHSESFFGNEIPFGRTRIVDDAYQALVYWLDAVC